MHSGSLVFSFVGFVMVVSKAVMVVEFLVAVTSAWVMALESGFSTFEVVVSRLILAICVAPLDLPPKLPSG